MPPKLYQKTRTQSTPPPPLEWTSVEEQVNTPEPEAPPKGPDPALALRLHRMITGDILEEQIYYEEQIIENEKLAQSTDLEYPEETKKFLALKTREYQQSIAACGEELTRRDHQGTIPVNGATAIDWTDKRAEIIGRLDVLSVFGERITLKKSGREYTGPCPFHEDKNPSFHLDPEKGLWHCFGCQAGGGLFDFVMQAEKISFTDALYQLGRRAGVELPARRGELIPPSPRTAEASAPPESTTRPARKTNWTIAELMATDFPDPSGPLPGIIPIGLTVLGGRPKQGKSWLMLQCAYALATGGRFLDHELAANKVIYYALEDSPRRLKDRLAKFDPAPDALIEFERELLPLDLEEGMDQIRAAAEDHYLIVIDTLGRAMPGRDFSKDGGLFAEVLGKLQTIAIEKNIAIVLILHTRKPAAMEHDPIDDILGSTQGLTAAPDCVLALYKEQGKTGARLQGRGRDFDDIDLTIEFDRITCAWQLVGITGEVVENEHETAILEAMQDLGKVQVSTIAKAIGKDRGNTSKRCANLWTRGLLKKEVLENITYYSSLNTPTQDTHTTQPTQPTQATQAIQGRLNA